MANVHRAEGYQTDTATPLPVSVDAANDVSQFVELVGNPSQERWQDEPYPRNVWDLEVFNNRMYIGSGNSDNRGASPNAGPIPVWSYDAATDTFSSDYIVPEEEIDRFVPLNETLYIPGHDPRESATQASIYVLGEDGWDRIDTVPHGLHIYDLAEHGGRLFAGLGIDAPIDGDVVASSEDDGQTWALSHIPVSNLPDDGFGVFRAWEFLEVGDDLLVNVVPAYIPERQYDAAGKQTAVLLHRASSLVYRLVADDETPPRFEELSVDFFNGQAADSESDWKAGRIVRPVRLGEQTVYIGAKTITDHNWTPIGLFSVDPDYSVRAYALESEMLPRDLLVEGETLYALVSQPQPSGETTVSVLATCDLINWREVLHFNTTTFARSFALYEGDFYFGQGTDDTSLVSDAGNILRIGSAHFDPACQ